MTKVLLTGGSGFIASHILEQLLDKGHSVVTTVRSEEKAAKLRQAYPGKSEDQLNVVVAPDISQPNAFDEVVKVPGIEVVLHTASPFHFNFEDPKELVDPAVNGTTGILKAVARSAPGVKRVVVTSSFAAILNNDRLFDPSATFSEKSWKPVTIEDVHKDKGSAYRASKTLAERAAWEFVRDESNGVKFDLATINPPLVFGPVSRQLASLESINTSNARILACLQGKWKNEVADTAGIISWVDVRDVATAHIKAGLEVPEAGGHRFFVTSGSFCNRYIPDIIKKAFPEYSDKLPGDDVKSGGMPDKSYKVDNAETNRLLGIKWIQLEDSIVETVKSLQALGA